MADVLSQSEVESLLASLDGAAVPHAAPRTTAGTQVTVYDFKRPERVSKEQMRAFHALHEGFSREMGAGLSGLVRTICEVKLISVDQLTYSEFVFSLENPTCFNLIESSGLDGHLILDLSPSIVFPIVDRLLGGGKDGRQQSSPSRPLTEIELRIAGRVTNLAIQALENAWANICPLKARVAQIESNPQLVQIVPPNEVVVLISFEISMAERRGILNLCIPFNAIESHANKLTSDSWMAYKRKVQDETQKIKLEAGLARTGVNMVVRMASTKLTTGDLMGLEVGDVIMTDQKAKEGAEVLIGDLPAFRASAGTLKGKKAIRITEQLRSPKTVVEEQIAEFNSVNNHTKAAS